MSAAGRTRRVLSIGLALCVSAACSGRIPAAPGSGAPSARSRPAASPTPSEPAPLLLSPLPPAAPPQEVAGPGVARTGPAGAPLAGEPAGRILARLRAGISVPVSTVKRGWARILTPCEITRWAPVGSLTQVPKSEVVLDPGHGGNEPGATGPGGLAEKTVNLSVGFAASEMLAGRGITALLTRSDDYRATLVFRTQLAAAAKPAVLVSIHHNAEPDGPMDRPGSETFYQIGSEDSKRLAGLMYEEAIRALSPLGADWVGDTDAGAKWRPNSRGGDYYGILRLARNNGITAILAELAYISNPSEEVLLSRQETRTAEAEAIAQAVTRYLRSKDPGSGFSTPYPREEPAGPGGGRTGCTDPS